MTMTPTKAEQAALPWYRHFWVWFVLFPPLLALLAGMAALVLAFHGADPEIGDGHQRVGMAVVAVPAGDAAHRPDKGSP
jgi:hypothetical protein